MRAKIRRNHSAAQRLADVVRKPHPVSGKMVTYMTRLFLALVMIEIASVIFAVDPPAARIEERRALNSFSVIAALVAAIHVFMDPRDMPAGDVRIRCGP